MTIILLILLILVLLFLALGRLFCNTEYIPLSTLLVIITSFRPKFITSLMTFVFE